MTREYEPYEEEGDRENECDHMEFSVDWEGRATCDYCLAHWWASPGQIAAQEKHEREYAEWVTDQERWEFWLKITAPARWLWYWLCRPWRPRTAIRSITDDEIPF